ncbi:MAG: hypothetical protein QOE35_2381 [Actinomycetota bacterium]|jgi:hypothetical protein
MATTLTTATTTLTVPTATLSIRPWPDPVIDELGHDPRSGYVETYWLGILGPSTTWLLRLLVARLERSPAGYDLTLAEAATRLGLGHKVGRHGPFVNALSRLVQFDLAQPRGAGELAVRRKVAPLSRRQVMRLDDALQLEHQHWQEGQLRTPALEQQRRRSRQLALSLVELGEDREEAERQLHRWKFHPAMAHEAVNWAWKRHCEALAAAERPDDAA